MQRSLLNTLNYGKDDDPDSDGKTNYQELLLNTHPLKTGIDEIIAETIFEQYQNNSGQWINNYYPYGTYTSHVNVKNGTLNLNNRVMVVKGNLTFIGGTISLGGGTLIVEGDLIQLNGTLDLNGGQLVVGGNILQSAGVMNINEGSLEVNGDYRIQTISTDAQGVESYTLSKGHLLMQSAMDNVMVNGNFVMDSWDSHNTLLSAGKLEVKGDFFQMSTYSYYSNREESNFSTSGTHKVVLSGDTKQVVSFEDALLNYSHFNKLEITNSSAEGIEFITRSVVIDEWVATETPIINNNNVVLNGKALISQANWNYDLVLNGYSGAWILQQDQVVAHDLYVHNLLDLNGHTLTVRGNVILSGHIADLDSGSLIVEGDVVQSGGVMHLNGGSLNIGGNYRIQSESTDAGGNQTYTYSAGQLWMTNTADYILVNGDFVTDSKTDHSALLTAGVFELKGDFTQQSTYEYHSAYEEQNFSTSGTHKVILSGDTKQVISFEDALLNYSHFNKLEITNSSAEGIEFVTRTVVIDEWAATVTPIINNSNVVLNGKALISQANWNYDLVLNGYSGAWVLQQDQVITHDLYVHNLLDLNGHTLTVRGNVILSGHMQILIVGL